MRHADEALVHVTGSGVRLVGLRVTQAAATASEPGGADAGSKLGHGKALELSASGSLFMEECTIGSEGGIGAWLEGSATIADSTVRGCKGAGLVVSGVSGCANLSRCRIEDNNGHGAEVEAGGTLSMTHCRIERNARGGLLARGRVAGIWDQCEVIGNRGCGVQVSHEADPRIQNSRIQGNHVAGVWVHDAGWGTVKANTIAGNGGAGLLVQSQGDPTVEGNAVHGNAAGQIVVEKGGWGTISELHSPSPEGDAPGTPVLTQDGEGASQTCAVG